MPNFAIAVLPGDGIGPDVVAEGLKVLRAVEAQLSGVSFSTVEFQVGAGEYLRSGDPLPEATFAEIAKYSTILLGAMGLPNVRWADGREMAPQIDIREKLGLYCGLRPIVLYHPDDTPLKGKTMIDFALVRESTEGLFVSRLAPYSLEADQVTDQMRITRHGAERVIRSAFEIAAGRRKKLTLVDKANVLPSMAYFRSVFDQIAREFPEIQTERVYVDACALYLVQRPESFDVLVTENMFGDILSDLAAALVGGMGMAPSADIGDTHAVFQPSHGSAPDIAGKGIANPVATILSVALLLDWLDHAETKRGAEMIRRAVSAVFADRSARTVDMGGSLSTSEMGNRIAEAVGA
jgi:3-isopropylmalate dehydrogenase